MSSVFFMCDSVISLLCLVRLATEFSEDTRCSSTICHTFIALSAIKDNILSITLCNSNQLLYLMLLFPFFSKTTLLNRE